MHCHRQVVGVVGMNGGQEGQVARNPTSGQRGAPPTYQPQDAPLPFGIWSYWMDGAGPQGPRAVGGVASHWGIKIPVVER
jgi:hypothetical protein